MKNVTFEELLKDEFFQEKIKEVKTGEEMSALLGSYRIIFPEEEMSAENGGPSEAAKKLAALITEAGFEMTADTVQESMNSSEDEELDEAALEEVAGGRGRRCVRVCTGRIIRICISICF